MLCTHTHIYKHIYIYIHAYLSIDSFIYIIYIFIFYLFVFLNTNIAYWRCPPTTLSDCGDERAQDEPSSIKTRYRLAKAQMGQSNWEAAAKTVDQALLSLKGWVWVWEMRLGIHDWKFRKG